MPSLGAVWWTAEVRQASEAASKAENLQEQLDQTGEAARQSNEATNATSRSMGDMSDKAGDASGSMGKLTSGMRKFQGTAGIVTSALFFLTKQLASLIGMTKGVNLLRGMFAAVSASTVLSLLPGSAAFGALFGSMTKTKLLKLLGVVSIFAILGGLVGGELGKLLGHENIGQLLGALSFGALGLAFFLGKISIGSILTRLTGGAVASYLGSISIGAILTKLAVGAGTLAGKLGSLSLGSIVNPLTGSLVLLLGGVLSLGDLVDGDISDWNLPAKFGEALGEGFENAWPDMADKIENAFMNNPAATAGEITGNIVRGEGRGAVEGENRELSAGLGTGFVDATEVPVLSQSASAGQATGDWIRENTPLGQSGGFIERGGLMQVHGGETLVPADIDRTAAPEAAQPGDMGGAGVTIEQMTVQVGDQTLDLSTLSRTELRDLADEIGDRFGREIESIVT